MDKFDSCCRLCLTASEPLHPIFGSQDNIPLQLSTCLSIEITTEDLLPKSICNKCSETLHNFYMFFINTKCCEQYLLTCLSNEPSQIFELKKEARSSEQDSPNHEEFLTEFLDMELLDSDANTLTALEYLSSDNDANHSIHIRNNEIKVSKITNCKGKLSEPNTPYGYYAIQMDIDVLDADLEIVNEILAKQSKSLRYDQDLSPSSLEENYSCLSCKAVFQDFEMLAHHMGGCDALKRTCSCCGVLFESKESMLKHKLARKEHLICGYCNMQFVEKDKLLQHIDQFHYEAGADSGVIYRCKKCSVVFQTRNKLYNHAKTHVKLKRKNDSNSKANANMKKNICDDCGIICTYETSLINHKRTQHESKASCVYRCKVCLKIFKNRDVLYKHIKQHTNVLESTQHLCDSCGQSFSSYNNLSKHVLIHVGNQFQCMICLKPFINGSLLKKHLSTHAIETQICELCGLVFSNNILLNMHQNDVHSVQF